MSGGYADRLSFREDLGGQLGAPELLDAQQELERKTQQLAEWARDARRIFLFTGAGISTSIGIPDFRGPNGIWTLQRAGKPIPKAKVNFPFAKPSLTHMIIAQWVAEGKASYVSSQNVDSLHLRSGVPRNKLAELHGDCFAERCPRCKAEYIRDFEMPTAGFKLTGRSCGAERCRGRLRDHVLDWEDALPDDELDRSEAEAARADLTLCLGTSLQIVPAADIPIKTVKAGGRMVICNLQVTPRDKHASLLVRGRSDDVMGRVARMIGMEVPDFVRTDRFILTISVADAAPPPPSAKRRKGLDPAAASAAAAAKPESHASGPGKQRYSILVSLRSVHGDTCPIPALEWLGLALSDRAAPCRTGTTGQTEDPCVADVSAAPWSVRAEAEAAAGPATPAAPPRVDVRLRLCDAVDPERREPVLSVLFPSWSLAMNGPDEAEGAGPGPVSSSVRVSVTRRGDGPAPASVQVDGAVKAEEEEGGERVVAHGLHGPVVEPPPPELRWKEAVGKGQWEAEVRLITQIQSYPL